MREGPPRGACLVASIAPCFCFFVAWRQSEPQLDSADMCVLLLCAAALFPCLLLDSHRCRLAGRHRHRQRPAHGAAAQRRARLFSQPGRALAEQAGQQACAGQV